MRIRQLLYGFVFTPICAFAGTQHRLEAGVSATSYRLGRQVQNEQGQISTLGDTYYNLRIQYHFPVTDRFFVSPEINYFPNSFLSPKSPDGGQTTNLNYFLLPVVFSPNEYFDFSAGFALMRYSIVAKGGTIELNNGSGSEDFTLPSRSVTTNTLAFSIGAAGTYKKARGGMNLLIQGPTSSLKRTYSIELFVGYPVMTFF